ncbi:LysM peptidoglycan-binding domain-containing protein [Arcanobacterium canis]
MNYWLISLSVALLFVYTLWHLTAWTLYFVAHRSRNTSLMLRLLTIAPRRIARKAAIALALPAFALSSPATAASIDLSWGGEIPSTSTSQLADGAHTDQSVVATETPPHLPYMQPPPETPRNVAPQPDMPPLANADDTAKTPLIRMWNSPNIQAMPQGRAIARTTRVRVRHGDSLWSIAHAISPTHTGELVERIWNENKPIIGHDPNLIYPGQILQIPEVYDVRTS